jgi:hypothetical protein
MNPRIIGFIAFLFSAPAAPSLGQQFSPNYDQSKVPQYVLPDPLICQSGKPVKDANCWAVERRPEILDLFSTQVYGRSPAAVEFRSTIVSTAEDALNATAVRREVDLTLERNGQSLTMSMLVYTPKGKPKSPLFLGLNFQGNHALEDDPRIRLPVSWMRARDDGSTEGNRATSKGRGTAKDGWPVEAIIQRGYGLATIYYGDIDPDFDDGFKNGIHPLFDDWASQFPAQERWGSIAAWAYGLSRALDFLRDDSLVDGTRVAVIGHSRLGKTALWAGAQDERFKLVISNNSGCGGAALSRRAFGETVGRINRVFPHWFCQNHRQYNENESELPVDQHQLIALVAPRPVYVASATLDQWADPVGEYLSCVHADPVYRLLGTAGLGESKPSATLPPPDHPLHSGPIGFHLRTGEHALTLEDWQHYLDFADIYL